MLMLEIITNNHNKHELYRRKSLRKFLFGPPEFPVDQQESQGNLRYRNPKRIFWNQLKQNLKISREIGKNDMTVK